MVHSLFLFLTRARTHVFSAIAVSARARADDRRADSFPSFGKNTPASKSCARALSLENDGLNRILLLLFLLFLHHQIPPPSSHLFSSRNEGRIRVAEKRPNYKQRRMHPTVLPKRGACCACVPSARVAPPSYRVRHLVLSPSPGISFGIARRPSALFNPTLPKLFNDPLCDPCWSPFANPLLLFLSLFLYLHHPTNSSSPLEPRESRVKPAK